MWRQIGILDQAYARLCVVTCAHTVIYSLSTPLGIDRHPSKGYGAYQNIFNSSLFLSNGDYMEFCCFSPYIVGRY
jgi:hypothetical protein